MNENWKTLPVENIGKENYNKGAGNNAGELQRKEVGECTDADKLRKQNSEKQLRFAIIKIIKNLKSPSSLKRIYDLAVYLYLKE